MQGEDRKTVLTIMWKVNRTVREMLRDRGYVVKQEELDIPREEFMQKHDGFQKDQEQTGMDFLVHHKDNPEKQIYVFFGMDAGTKLKGIRAYFEQMAEHGIKHGIMIYSGNISPTSKKTVADMADRYRLEIFSDKDLTINITRHTLVPEHIPLTEEEKK
ncbi:MAG: DNA-directed RNA polymerases I, II, and III subunit RPABC1, partial [Amphiamblys sp. WSBS2006]